MALKKFVRNVIIKDNICSCNWITIFFSLARSPEMHIINLIDITFYKSELKDNKNIWKKKMYYFDSHTKTTYNIQIKNNHTWIKLRQFQEKIFHLWITFTQKGHNGHISLIWNAQNIKAIVGVRYWFVKCEFEMSKHNFTNSSKFNAHFFETRKYQKVQLKLKCICKTVKFVNRCI